MSMTYLISNFNRFSHSLYSISVEGQISSSLHLKKDFLLGGCRFFVSDVISGGLLGHLGPLCLALGANR